MSALYRTLTGQSQKSDHSHQTAGSQPAQPTLTRTTTTDPLTGTLNHLTGPQEHKLDEFKEKLLKGGWWSPDGVNGKPTHDDGTLLRYLRARKFDVQGAIGQFTDTEKWLKEQMVEELYDTFDVETYEHGRQLYPQWTGHRDRRGIPIYVYVIKQLDSRNVSKYQKESQKYKDSLPKHKKLQTPAKLLPLFALYQNLLTFVLPFVSTLERPNPEVPITNSTNIVDISNVGLTQFWNLKAHMQDASVLATAHYPETLDRIFIIGAPNFFPTVWGWIKRWFDPVTVSKIFILSKHDVKPTLSKFMDPKDFPKRYGGELNWDWGDMPSLDDETRTALEGDGNKGWVRGPCLWLEGKRVPVGMEKGKPRRPLTDVEKMKPIVYAADYTETPVHPDKRLSVVSKGSSGKETGAEHHRAEQHSAVASGGPTIANTIATKTNSEQQAQVPVPQPEPPQQVQAPVSQSEPQQQAQAPVPVPEPELHPQPHTTPAIAEPRPVEAMPSPSTSQSSRLLSAATTIAPPPQPQHDPIPQQTLPTTLPTQNPPASESIAANAPMTNGHVNGYATGPKEGYHQVNVADDPATEAAIETEKLKITDEPHQKKAELERPPIERFVTALEG